MNLENLKHEMSISELKLIASKNKSYWFTDDAMRFFNSRIETAAYRVSEDSAHAYFISSEKEGARNPRRYTIQQFNLSNADIEHIGEFQQYSNLATALKALNKYLGEQAND